MALNPADILAKWKRNSGNSVEDMKAGVRKVTVPPTQKAAAAKDKYLRNVQAAVNDGRYEASLNAVTLGEWQNSMLDKGAANYTTGVNKISPRAQRAMADQQAAAEAISQEVQAMPNNNEQDAEQRMLTAVRKMREYGKRAR